MSNDELQKAIDDITSGEGAVDSVAPTSSDGGMATVSLPDDMMAQNINNNENATDFSMPDLGAPKTPAVETPDLAKPVENATDFSAPVFNAIPEVPKETQMNAPVASPETLTTPPAMSTPEVKMPELSADGPEDPQLKEVETSALLELYPLLEKMNVNAREKFDICMKVIEKTGEKGAAAAALAAAKEIADEKERGECLTKLVESIEKM